MTPKDHTKIVRQIEELDDLSVNQLREKWVEVWKEPCRSRNKDFQRKRIAWRIQVLAYGGLSQRALERAGEIADETLLKIRNPQMPLSVGNTVHQRFTPSDESRLPTPGSVITRTYNGRKLMVSVLDRGFEFEGKIYKSLSPVAKVVTGSHWNGFLFFGLKNGKGWRDEGSERSHAEWTRAARA